MAEARSRRSGLPRTSSHELRGLVEISQEGLARLMRVSVRTVARWESGSGNPSPAMLRRLEYLLKLVKRVGDIVGLDKTVAWLETPNSEFLNQPPIDLIQSQYGCLRLEQELDRTEWGIPG